jgi:hypothetical protein
MASETSEIQKLMQSRSVHPIGEDTMFLRRGSKRIAAQSRWLLISLLAPLLLLAACHRPVVIPVPVIFASGGDSV